MGRLKINLGLRPKVCFLGYPYGKKGCKFYYLHTHEFLTARDVVFIETDFPYLTNSSVVSLTVSNTLVPIFGELPLGVGAFSPPRLLDPSARGACLKLLHSIFPPLGRPG